MKFTIDLDCAIKDYERDIEYIIEAEIADAVRKAVKTELDANYKVIQDKMETMLRATLEAQVRDEAIKMGIV